MAEFREAFENTMKFEDATLSGKVTVDAGGRTRFGIAEKFHPQLGDTFFTGDAHQALAEAESIEQSEYWEPLHLGEIASQAVANKLFDMAVNMGARQAAVFAQRAANALLADGGGRGASPTAEAAPHLPADRLAEDGVLGPRTVAAINRLDPQGLLQVLRELSAGYYRHVASVNPAQAVNLPGWLRRAAA